MFKKTISFTVFFTFFSALAFGQSIFSGNWQRKQLYPIEGPNYGNAMQIEMKVHFTKDSLILETITPASGGKTTKGRQAYSLDGKPFTTVSTVSNRKLVKSYSVSSDNQSMILTTVFYAQGNDNQVDLTRIETWSIENGQLIIQKKSIETIAESWEVKGVFDRK